MAADFDVDELLNQQLEEQKKLSQAATNENTRSGKEREDVRYRSDRAGDRERSSRERSSRERSSRERSDRHRDDRYRDDRDRHHRDRSRDDRRDRDRDRDRSSHRSDRREYGRESRERSDRHRERRSRDRDDRRSRDRDDRRSRDRDDRRSRDREDREPRAAPAPRRPRTPTPERELKNMQRMACTVMAYGLSVLAEEMDIFEFFAQAGDLVDVKVIRDRHSTRHKGIAYIEYKERADVLNALQLNGQKLKGMPVNVKPSEAEKNFAWESAELQKKATRMRADPEAAGMEAGGPTMVRVENIPNAGLSEDDVREVFGVFGTVSSLRFERDGGGAFTGVAYVQFPTAPEARKAVLGLDSTTDLGSAPLRLTVVDMHSTYPYQSAPSYAPGELDEGDEHGGMRLNASARTALMGRMSGAAGIERPKEPALPPPPPVAPAAPVIKVDAAVEADKGLVGQPSPNVTQCLLLKNMFDPAQESGEEWPAEIEMDTKEECSKFGTVLHVHVDPHSKGFVYLKFGDAAAAAAAQKALHGRWYSNNQIVACFQIPQLYNRYFHL